MRRVCQGVVWHYWVIHSRCGIQVVVQGPLAPIAIEGVIPDLMLLAQRKPFHALRVARLVGHFVAPTCATPSLSHQVEETLRLDPDLCARTILVTTLPPLLAPTYCWERIPRPPVGEILAAR